MNFALVFVVALALTGAANVNAGPVKKSSELKEDLKEFIALVPQDKVAEIIVEYMKNDAEVQATVKYVQSDAFKDLITKIDSIDDVINYYDYLEESGLEVYAMVNKLHEAIGIPPLIPSGLAGNVNISGGVSGLIADIKATLPIDKIKALHEKKLKTSPAFAQLVARLKSPRFHKLIDALRVNTEFQKLLKIAKEAGIDLRATGDLYATMFGFKFPSSRSVERSNELHEVLSEFVALVPQDEVAKIIVEYMKNDAEVQATVKYVQSDAFKELVKKIDSIGDVINYYDYLEESGLDIYAMVNKLHEAIGIPPLVPSGLAGNVQISGGVAGLIADIKATLPIDKINALHEKKLKTSPAFAQLVARLKSPRFQKLIDALGVNTEFQKLLKIAKEAGIDLRATGDLYATMFGFKFPSSRSVERSNELHEVLSEFVALVPQDEVAKIIVEYMKNDAEVQATVKYVQSDAFKELVKKIDSIGDVINYYDYLEESGLDIYAMVNKLHEAIGIPPLVPSGLAGNVQISGGVAGLIADIKATLPIDKINALHEKKLKTSPAFAQLVARLKSPRFQKLIDALGVNTEFQKLLKIAKEAGIDLRATGDLYATMFGFKFHSSRSVERSNELHEVLSEFVALVPQDEVAKIIVEYMKNDAEVQATVKYVQSDAFKELVKKIDSIGDVINYYDYLEESGLDIYAMVNKLHEAIGIPPLVPSGLAGNVQISGGVAGLIADIKATLPIDKINALHEKKLKTSPAFAQLVARLKSPRFQKLIDALGVNTEFQKLLKIAKEAGIDLRATGDLYATMFGFKFPSSRSVERSNELHEVLSEFVALVPQDEVAKIIVEYMKNDAEVQATVKYVQSDAFKELVKKIDSIGDVINYYDYLEESGLDIYAMVNKLHEAIGIPPLVPSGLAGNVQISGGVAGLIADIKATLPIDKINALHEKKLKTSPAFAQLVARLKSPRFHKLIDALRVNTEFQKLLKIAKEAGIDLRATGDLYATMFGFKFPSSRSVERSNELHEVLGEFVALLPRDKIAKIAVEYLKNDAQVQGVVKYIQSDGFKELVKKVESIDDVINFYDYLEKSGLHIYYLVNNLHEAMGLPPFVPGGFARNLNISGGVAGLIADIKATLPIDKIKVLYHNKLETSPAFVELIEHFKSPRFQELIDALRANEEFQKIVRLGKEAGVDVRAIVDLLITMLGLEFPERPPLMNVQIIENGLSGVMQPL